MTLPLEWVQKAFTNGRFLNELKEQKAFEESCETHSVKFEDEKNFQLTHTLSLFGQKARAFLKSKTCKEHRTYCRMTSVSFDLGQENPDKTLLHSFHDVPSKITVDENFVVLEWHHLGALHRDGNKPAYQKYDLLTEELTEEKLVHHGLYSSESRYNYIAHQPNKKALCVQMKPVAATTELDLNTLLVAETLPVEESPYDGLKDVESLETYEDTVEELEPESSPEIVETLRNAGFDEKFFVELGRMVKKAVKEIQ